MARLPTPGGDPGNWGNVLNDYLSQAHASDGTLKSGSVGASQLQDNSVTAATIADSSITESQLDSNIQTKLNTPGTIGDGTITKAKLATAVQTSLDKADVAPVIGTGPTDAKAGDYQPTAASISDATATGRSILTATDATAARTAIGAGTSNLALGTTSTTAKAGDYAPTKTDVGLGNVDNTSDTNKPVSTATQTALDSKLSTTTADTKYAPLKLFTHTYIPTNTAADFTALQAVINAWSASGLPGVIRIGAGTLPLSGDGTVGALRIPANKPALLIEGAGEAATKFVLSRSVPRLFDLYGTGAGNVFDSITVRNFSVDAGGVTPTTIGSTTVTANVTLQPDQYTTVQVASNVSFAGAGTRWASARSGGAGTLAGSRMLFLIPAGTTTLQLWNTTGSAKTLVSGDVIDGYLYDHVIFGNNNVGSTSGTGQSASNVLIENIRASNIPTQYVSGLSTFTPSIRFGVYVAPGVGGYVEGLTVRNVHITGGECGIMSTGSAGSWINDVVFEDCSHDTNLLPTMNSGSLNFMIGQHSYVGNVRVDRCIGRNSADVGLEIDQAMHSTITDCQMIESYSAPYYVTNFVVPARSIAGPLQSTLSADITSGATSCTVAALPAGFPRRGYAKIGSEIVMYVATSSTALTLTRGMNQSTAAAATSGAAVIAIEADAQIGIYQRCRAVNILTPGKGWWFNPNSFLPMQAVRLRDCSTRSVVTDLDLSQSVLIFGCVMDVDIENHVADVSLQNTVSQPTGVYAAIKTWRPGEAGRLSSIGRPMDVKIRKCRISINGSVASTSSLMRPVWLAEGWYRLDLDVEVRNMTTGFAVGGTSGVFIGGSTIAQVQSGTVALRYVSTSTSDSVPHVVYLGGSVGISDRINLRLDLAEMYSTTNQLPWDIPAAQRDQVTIEHVTPPRLDQNLNSRNPVKITSMTTSPFTAKHVDRVILVNMASAVGTVNLPVTNSGNALAIPRPGAGTAITIKDISGAASSFNITVNPAAGETIDGASSKVISTNYGSIALVSTGTGWAVL